MAADHLWKRDGVFYFKMKDPATGKLVVQSLQVRDRDTARAKAKALAKDLLEKRWDRIMGVRARTPLPTLEEIGKIYTAAYQELEIEKRSAKENFAYLTRIAIVATGNTAPGPLALTWVDGEAGALAVREYKRKSLAARLDETSDDDEERTAKRTINSALRQARSVFTPEAMQLYQDRGLQQLPNVAAFKAEPYFPKVEKTDYSPPDDRVLSATFAALELLREGKWERPAQPKGGHPYDPETQVDMYKAICLAVGAGLRKSEINRAQPDWFVMREGRPWLLSSMITKNGKGIDIPILADWWARIAAILPADATTILKNPGENVFRCIGAWMTELGWKTEKKAHEFRAYVGCQVALAHGIEAASLFLRHSEIKTTQKYYGRYLKLRSVDGVKIGCAPTPAPAAPETKPAAQIIPLPVAAAA